MGRRSGMGGRGHKREHGQEVKHVRVRAWAGAWVGGWHKRARAWAGASAPPWRHDYS